MRKRRSHLPPDDAPLAPLPPPGGRMSTAWAAAAVAVSLAYVLFAAAHASLTPVAASSRANYINAPDEAAHLACARLVRDERRLPTAQDSARTYEWHQPPLYYALAAAVVGGGPGAVRGLGILIGLAGVGVVFVAARRLFPLDPPLAVLAMGFAALLPMRHAVTSAAGNDGLTELTFSCALLGLATMVRTGATPRRAAVTGAALGLALLSKSSAVLLLPVALLAAWLQPAGKAPRSVLATACVVIGAALALGGWWYARNAVLYGEALPTRMFAREFAGTARAADLIGRPDPSTGRPMTRGDYTAMLAALTSQTFWAAWTPTGRPAELGIPFTLPGAFYALCWLLVSVPVCALGWMHFRRREALDAGQRRAVAVLLAALALVFLSFAGFTWTYFQAQGRYLYPAMLPLALLFAFGWRGALPERWRDLGTGAVLTLLGLLSLAFVLTAIAPAYGS